MCNVNIVYFILSNPFSISLEKALLRKNPSKLYSESEEKAYNLYASETLCLEPNEADHDHQEQVGLCQSKSVRSRDIKIGNWKKGW